MRLTRTLLMSGLLLTVPACNAARETSSSWEKLFINHIADETARFYDETKVLKFEAELTRQVKDRTDTRYLAKVTMTPERVNTIIYDPDHLDLPLVEFTGGKEAGQNPIWTPPLTDQIDVCLFGTLTVSWLDPSSESDRPYIARRPGIENNRVRNGRFTKITTIRGQPCYQVQYTKIIPEVERKVIERYCVNTDTFSLTQWDSVHYDLASGESVMTVTRKYRQLEPTALSAESETIKGENR